MTGLRNLFMAIGSCAVLIGGFAHDAFPTEWNQALAVMAVACVSGVLVIAYATRNEAQR